MLVIGVVLNLLGMGYLFYIYELQKKVNSSFIENVILHNAIIQMFKEKIDKLEEKVKELELQKNKL